MAEVESSKLSYFISRSGSSAAPGNVDDEAIIEVSTRIIDLKPAQPAHMGMVLEVSLISAKSYNHDSPNPAADRPMLYSVQFRKTQRSALAYLPSEPFWALQTPIAQGRVKRIEISYSKPVRGFAQLESLHLAT